ncbi:MAG: sensor histidine kinase [Bacteroidota bacterium]
MLAWILAIVGVMTVIGKVEARAIEPTERRLVAANAPVLELNDAQGMYAIGRYVEMLEDPSHRLTLAEVASLRYDSLFQRSKQDIPNFGYSRADYWFRLKVKNRANDPESQWLLEIGYPLIDQVELYFFHQDGTYQIKKAGDLLPFHQREIQYPTFVVGLALDTAQVHTIYLHFSGHSSKQFPMYLWKSLHFFQEKHQEDMAWGCYFGILLVMILYNLFLYFSIRHITYLYYVLYISCFMLVQLSISGYAYQFLWPTLPWFADLSNVFFLGFTIFFGMCFSISLLNIRQMLPRLYPLMIGLGALGLVISVVTLTELVEFPTRIAAMLSLACAFTLFSVGLFMLRKGYRPARFYMIAWTALLLSLIIYISKNAALLPNNFFTNYCMQFGSAMEVILLSLGLGDSINSMKREREKAQLEVILALQENDRIKDAITEELEKKVAERTQEISKQKEELEVLNATKDKFFSIVAHDLKGPLNSMTGFFDLLANHAGMLSAEETQKIAKNLSQSVENTTRLTDNLLTWAMAQMNTLKHQPKAISLSKIIVEKSALFKESADKKQIALQTEIQPGLGIFADENHIRFVLRNLISNALKFTKPAGTITISAIFDNETVKVSVSDDGVGMDEEVLNKIFQIESKYTSEGTSGEKGTGLGLLLCKEFVERNNGKLWATSLPGKGSTFTFSMKKLAD